LGTWAFPEHPPYLVNKNLKEIRPSGSTYIGLEVFALYRDGSLAALINHDDISPYNGGIQSLILFPESVRFSQLDKQLDEQCIVYKGRLKCDYVAAMKRRLNYASCNPNYNEAPCRLTEEDFAQAVDLGPADSFLSSTGNLNLCKLSSNKVTCYNRPWNIDFSAGYTPIDWDKLRNRGIEDESELTNVQHISTSNGAAYFCLTYVDGASRCFKLFDNLHSPQERRAMELRNSRTQHPVAFTLGRTRCTLSRSGFPQCSGDDRILDFHSWVIETRPEPIMAGLLPASGVAAKKIIPGSGRSICILDVNNIMRCLGSFGVLSGVNYKQDYKYANDSKNEAVPARWPLLN